MTSQPAAAAAAPYTRSSILLRPVAFICLLMPAALAVAAGVTGAVGYLWLFPAAWWLGVPLLDRLLPRAECVSAGSRAAVSDGGSPAAHRLIVPIVALDLLAMTWFVATVAPPVHAVIAAGLSLAVVIAIAVVSVRHLVPARDKLDAALSVLATALIGWPFYRRALTVDHHRACATPADPLSARMGEGYWKFVWRALGGLTGDAWRQVRRPKASPPLAIEIGVTLALYGAAVTWGGVPAGLMLSIAWAGAVLLVLAVHYVQHYGLLRRKRTDGAYARLGAEHAWDDRHSASALLTFNASRHAHAHLEPRCPCAALECLDGAPVLPFGLATATAIAMFPPAWFRHMDPLAAAWAGGDLQRVNIDGGAYATLMARYHRPASS